MFEGKLNILFIGRLAEIKGVHLLIKAASKLKDKIPLEIKILGDGPERKKLSQLAIDEHVDDFVTLVGAVREKQEYYDGPMCLYIRLYGKKCLEFQLLKHYHMDYHV